MTKQTTVVVIGALRVNRMEGTTFQPPVHVKKCVSGPPRNSLMQIGLFILKNEKKKKKKTNIMANSADLI